MEEQINYEYFYNEIKKNKIDEIVKEKTATILKKIDYFSIFLANLRVLLESKVEYYNRNKTLDWTLNDYEINSILYNNLDWQNVEINGFLYDYCSIDRKDVNHLLAIMSSFLSLYPLFWYDDIFIYLYKKEIKEIFILINSLIEYNSTINDLVLENNQIDWILYYNDNDLLFLKNNFELKWNKDKNNILTIWNNSEFKSWKVEIAFNSDWFNIYKIPLTFFKEYSGEIIDKILLENKIYINMKDINIKEELIKVIDKENANINSLNSYTNIFWIWKLEDVYEDKQVKAISNNFIKKLLSNFITYKYLINKNIDIQTLTNEIKKALK